MSDDLISRKAAVELVIAEYDRFQANGGSHSGRYELDKVIKILQNMPTTFDKEKVIEEIQKEGDIAELHQLNLLYDKKADDEEHFKRMQFELDRGYSVAMFRARKIVEKGGV